ncbi:SRPBCC family protein [Jannaschia aquimarina]|uniref:Activator of Hsp90 ATPase homologue 1/2-like C-terminal domain-containing protein n=1 Tax=Jannaschia aquimarina TaxID=935700 RepID=A0A0D1ENX1_9RHOB|nr:SRPBCC domain-containing protein [Jannaschia aquimarina]KIT17335.1 hypothetical protein jaqu_10670 [Jannaschia aquimarina]SNT20492.1 Uncharacterized conserved protein YndB, AHSA1/START domain [Jannaschia aquimarina]
MPDIRRTVTLAHPPERVWRALTDSDAIAVWLMPNDFRPEVGHRFTMTTKPAPGFDGTVRCEVLTLDPPKELSFSWVGGNVDTIAMFRLAPEGDHSTRLTVTQGPFKGVGQMVTWGFLNYGWNDILVKKLPAHLSMRGR